MWYWQKHWNNTIIHSTHIQLAHVYSFIVRKFIQIMTVGSSDELVHVNTILKKSFFHGCDSYKLVCSGLFYYVVPIEPKPCRFISETFQKLPIQITWEGIERMGGYCPRRCKRNPNTCIWYVQKGNSCSHHKILTVNKLSIGWVAHVNKTSLTETGCLIPNSIRILQRIRQ